MGGKLLQVVFGGFISFSVANGFVSSVCANTTGWNDLTVSALCEWTPMIIGIGVLYGVLRVTGIIGGNL